ncbi:MAG: Mpo1-like protein [Thermoanaerobaculia bacterium]
MNARAARLFADYAEAHSTAGNRICHSIGIPLIVFSVVLALTRIPIAPPGSAAEPVIAAVTVAALALDTAASMPFFIFLVVADLVSRAIPSWTSPTFALGLAGGLFAAGWIVQFVGHSVYEGNRPAFLRNLAHLLVGPLWIARKLL